MQYLFPSVGLDNLSSDNISPCEIDITDNLTNLVNRLCSMQLLSNINCSKEKTVHLKIYIF